MTDVTAAIAESPAVDPAQRERRQRLLRILGLVVVAGVLIWAVWYYLTQAGRVHTDNAYVGADTAQVTPLVSGAVREVRVGGTQLVQKDEILVILDDADARIEVATAAAALRQAQQRYQQTTAMGNALRAQVDARGADTGQAQARLSAAQAEFEKARLALDRRTVLSASGAVSGEELSIARAGYAEARAGLAQAQAAISTASATRAAALGELASNEALTRNTNEASAPDVAAAQARLELAQLNLARTVIRAPIAGVVTQRQVQLGQRLTAGTPIMTLVPIASSYVDANFKEAQLRKVRPGQKVELTSDFYGSSVVYHGRVVGFAGGTGAAFALIPAQNATGNWVKVVQRLPVRISLDRAELREHPLRIGLSMDVIVDTRR